MAEIRSHRDLRVWASAMDLAEAVYQLAKTFPAREEYRLTSQMIRAAISIPANIAEGHARGTRKDYTNSSLSLGARRRSSKHFFSLRNARGSVQPTTSRRP